MKKLIGLLVGLVFCVSAAAQNTTVTATVTDSDGTLWANGTVAVQFVPNPAQPNQGMYKECSSGAALNPALLNQLPVTLGGAGQFSITALDNSQICPSGSQWQFTVCPQASSKCGIIVLPVSGTSQSITTQVDALIPAPRFQAIAGNFGYADVEAQLQLEPGGLYYNVTDLCYRQFSGSTFSCLGAGNPFTIPIPINQGGSASTTAAGALANLNGLSTVLTTPQTMAGALNAPVLNGIYGASQFGIKCDGFTDDSAALNSIGTFAAGQTSAGKTVTVSFPSNATCVHSSTITNWIVTNLHLIGNGARLKFTGSGKQIYLHGTTGTAEYDNIWIEGFVLQGNPNATDGLYQDNTTVAHSRFDIINAQDFTNSCFYLPNVQVSQYLFLSCSNVTAQVMGVPQATTPNYGLIAGDPAMLGGDGFFANNRVVTITLDGLGEIGLWCKNCSNQNHFFGTAEQTSSSSGTVGIGLVDAAAGLGQGNTFSLDLEGNAVADAQIEGFGETFLSTVSLGNFTVLSDGLVNIIGGEYQQITLNSGHAPSSIVGILYNSLQTSGTLTGNISSDCVINAINRVGGAVTNNCLTGSLLSLSGGTITGNLGISGVTSFGSPFTTGAATGTPVLFNGNFLSSDSAAHNVVVPMIGLNSSNQVSIDPSGNGSVFGAPIKVGSNNIVEAGTPTAGQAACIKSSGPPVVIGFCSTTPTSGTCTCN